MWNVSRRFWQESQARKIKMASRCNISIAEELSRQLEPQPFTKILCMLDNKSCTSVEQFKWSNLFMSSSQWIDSRKFLTCRGAAIASGIFELFGQFWENLGTKCMRTCWCGLVKTKLRSKLVSKSY